MTAHHHGTPVKIFQLLLIEIELSSGLPKNAGLKKSSRQVQDDAGGDVIDRRDPIACSPDSKPRVLTDPSGWFASPNYPGAYPNGASCHWLILASDPDKIVRLDADFFRTERGYDFVTVHDGNTSTSPIVAGFDGTVWDIPPKNIRTTGPAMYVTFASDLDVTDIGFNLTFATDQLDLTPDPCYSLTRPLVLNDYNGIFQSKNHPQPYWDYSTCQWLIEAQEPNSVVQIDLNYLTTERNYDYLYLYDGNSASAPLIASLHGVYNSGLGLFNSTGPSMFVQLLSDELIVFWGFNGTYTILQTSECGTSLTKSSNDTVILPGYDVMCELDAGDPLLADKQCYDLLQNITGIGDANALLSRGGNFGCTLSTRQDNVGAENACYDNYQWQTKLSNCPSCTKLFVCVRFS